jgi:hypothetical protein
MSKITNMVIFIIVSLLLVHFAGLLTDTPIGFTLSLALDIENIKSSGFYGLISAALGILAIGGVFISFFAPQVVSLTVKRLFVLNGLLVIGWDLLILFQLLKQVNVALATIIISPMMIIYLIASFEWWK